MPYHKKRKPDRPPKELIPEYSMKTSGAAVLDGKPVNERCCKRVWCYSHDIRAIRQQIRATSDTICRPVYATNQISTDEEERTLSDYLLCATKLHYGLSWKTTRPIQKNMSKLILTDYINVANRGTNVKSGHQPIWVTLS